MSFAWGMVGHGNISAKFRAAMGVVAEADIVAVAGRDAGRAQAYATEHHIAAAFASVDEMLSVGGLDAVYICTPHPAHLASALACIEAGVPVLVEKPLTPNYEMSKQLADAASSASVFAMEAMWTRFLPVYADVRAWIDSGRIGEVQQLDASFGFRAPMMPEYRLFSPDLAGGATLDVGVYPIGLAQWLFGSAPEALHAAGTVGETGVDGHVATLASYPGGGLAQLGWAVRANLANHAVIRGTDGHIEIPIFWAAQAATLHAGDQTEAASTPHRANGFEYQIEEVMACVANGQTESATMPMASSLEIAAVCDQVRRQLGVTYPFEHK